CWSQEPELQQQEREASHSSHLKSEIKVCAAAELQVYFQVVSGLIGDKKGRKLTRMIGLPLLLLLLLLFWLLPPSTAKKIQTMCVLPKQLKFQYQWEFYRPDAAHCEPCPEDQIPNKDKDQCIVKKLHFLTYQDNLGYSLASLALSLSVITLLLLAIIKRILGVGFEFSQGDRRVYPSFFRINPKEFHQYEGLVQMLLYFQWNWVGLVASKDDSGEHFVSSLVPMLKEKEICLAFPEIFSSDIKELGIELVFKILVEVEVIILFGDSHTIMLVGITLYHYRKSISLRKVWVLPSYCELSMLGSKEMLLFRKYFHHGTLHFRDKTRDVSEFSHFLLSLDPLNPEGDDLFPL
ncbi:hypothetical protein E2320_022164, partial [Naja naja]